MGVLQKIGWVMLGVVSAVAIACLVVGIGCAVNGVTFAQQITNWFGTTAIVPAV